MSNRSVFRPDLLAGKVAFVTGGGSGICEGITRAYLEHGASAAIVGRNAERLAETAARLSRETGKKCIPVQADVRQPDAVDRAVEEAIQQLGGLDIVVNGAAGNFLAPAAMLSPNGFRTVMEIDAHGTWHVCKAAFERRLRDHGGVILNISATLHYGATPMQVHASAAKAAVDAITRSLAFEWGGLGIRVVGIAPGPIEDTEGVKRLVQGGLRDKLVAGIPLGRFGRIDEIASLAVFLVSEGASLITGETVIADGGAWLGGSAASMLE